MSDQPPDQPSGLWARYRAMPGWLQALIPVVLVAIIIGAIWLVADSGSEDEAASTTIDADEARLDAVLKGLILVGGAAALAPSDTAATTSPAPATTETPETTDAPGTTEATATTDAPATTEATATTDAPATTEAPATTDAPVDTEAPPTTEEPADTSAPPTTNPPQGMPTTSDFVANWNDAATGPVPTISVDEATELTGTYAGYHLITLSPQVGLVGSLTSPGSGQLAQVLLVWIPGDDDGSSDFYWDCFNVLTQAVSPGISAEDTASLERDLGRAAGQPPFTTTANASSNGLDYRRFTQHYEGEDETIDVSAISVQ